MNSESQTLGNPLARLGRALLHWFDTGRSSSFEGAEELLRHLFGPFEFRILQRVDADDRGGHA